MCSCAVLAHHNRFVHGHCPNPQLRNDENVVVVWVADSSNSSTFSSAVLCSLLPDDAMCESSLAAVFGYGAYDTQCFKAAPSTGTASYK
jgi:hypothetical protein